MLFVQTEMKLRHLGLTIIMKYLNNEIAEHNTDDSRYLKILGTV